MIPTAALMTGASICRLLSPRQYPLASPTHTSPGVTIDASSSHDPKYATAFADAAGALVDVVAVTGDARPLCDARDELETELDDDLSLSFVCPGALSLRPCAWAGPATTREP